MVTVVFMFLTPTVDPLWGAELSVAVLLPRAQDRKFLESRNGVLFIFIFVPLQCPVQPLE